MNDEPDPDAVTDDEAPMLDALGRALGTDAPPPGLAERAESLLGWFDVDDELVALLQEHADEPAGVRGASSAATAVRTEDGSVAIDIEFDHLEITGHVVGGDVVRIELVESGGAPIASSDVDELGGFRIAASQRGPHRLRLVRSGGETILSEWFLLTV